MPDDVAERVKSVVARVLKVDPSEVADASSFARDLGAQSLDSIKLVAAFEDEFDIEMNEDEALAVQTVGKAVEFIRKTIKEQQK